METNPAPTPPVNDASPAARPWLQVYGSAHFPEWLAGQRLSLAFTTYQAGKLLFLGRHPDGRMAVFERTFQRCMSLCGDGQTLWLSTLSQLWRFENSLAPGESYQGADRLYIPRAAHTTGDLTSTMLSWNQAAGWSSSTLGSAVWRP